MSLTVLSGDDWYTHASLQGRIESIVVTDVLPVGFSYQAGSLRVDGERVTPGLSADGRTLSIPVAAMGAGTGVEIRYVALVGPAARAGDAINQASARGAGGVVSNEARAAVRIRDPLFTSHFTIIGQVLAGACDAAESELQPLAGVRLFMEDGTYVATDENGAYHFQGVRPGTHVVQLDPATVPGHLEALPCHQDTRRAGRGDSQFVEAEGGALMRADFRLQPRGARTGEVGIVVSLAQAGTGIRHVAGIDEIQQHKEQELMEV